MSDDFVENLKTANENRERENAVNAIWVEIATELREERDRAVKYAEAAPHPGSAPWKEMRAVYAERDRLRDIVRRLADSLQGIMDAAFGKGEGVLDEALLREARAALGEGETPTGKGVGR